MKISKLFHWLYAILMFLPFGLVVYNSLASMWSGVVVDDSTWYSYVNSFFNQAGSLGIYGTVYNVYDYLIGELFIVDVPYDIITNLLTYWTCISIIWLVFDVFMYVPLLVHRWIDKAKLE